MSRNRKSTVAPKEGSIASCLVTVLFTFFLLITALILSGALVDSHGAYANGECQVSRSYPPEVLQWCSLISGYAQEHDLDPDLVAALIWHESGGRAHILSRSGAVGLMQVMPRDGKAASFLCADVPCFADRPSMHELQKPDFNIHYGTQLLQNLLVQFHGDTREALKAYGPFDAGYAYADTILNLYYQHRGN